MLKGEIDGEKAGRNLGRFERDTIDRLDEAPGLALHAVLALERGDINPEDVGVRRIELGSPGGKAWVADGRVY